MNCIVLLLLLSCCGCGNGSCGNGCGCRGTGHGNRMDCATPHHRRARHGDSGCGRKPEPCGCEPERPCPKPEPCGCAREERECDAPSSGLIPPPWQDYPKFPHRDEECGCES